MLWSPWVVPLISTSVVIRLPFGLILHRKVMKSLGFQINGNVGILKWRYCTKYKQCGSGTEPRTAKRTGNIGTEPEPFIFTNRTEPNRCETEPFGVRTTNRNRLRTAGICLFSIHSSTGFFARVRPVMFLAFPCHICMCKNQFGC